MTASQPRCPVVILGAGLTGLSAALHLRERGVPFRILEREAQVGGLARTDEERGFRFDRTGHLLHLRDPALRARVLGWLGDAPLTLSRQSRVWSHGVLTRYPFQAHTYGLPPQVAYDCVMGFLAARLAPANAPPRDFVEYCHQHFGAGFSEQFLLPYNARLWGVPLESLTAAWCERFVPVPAVEDVIAGALGLPDRELGYNAHFVYPRQGIGELAASMHRALDASVELGRSPLGLDPVRRELHLEGETLRYETLVSTLPLPSLLHLISEPSTALAARAAQLRATPLRYLDLAIDAPARSELHWVYLPEARHLCYRIGCYSNFSPAMVPEGKSSYYVELVDRAEPDLDVVVPTILATLREIGLIRAGDALAFARARWLDPAYVIFDAHHAAATTELHEQLTTRRIVSTGRYGGWNYSSMEDALRFGRDAAERVTRMLDE